MTQSEGRPEINLQRETLDYSYRAVVWDIAIMVILIAVLILNPFEPVAWSSKKILLYLACLVGSLPVIISAVREALQRRLSMDLLSGLALVASILAGQLVSAIFIAMMLTASRMLGDWSDRLVRRGVRSLLRLRPHSVKVEIRDEIFEKPVHELRPGDIVIAESGKRIAVDGLVIDGAAAVDESSLTGESLPVRKEVNSRVFSSTLVAEGHLKIRAEKVGRDTTLEKIVKLVEGAQAQKSRMTTLAEKFGKIYIISVMLVSVVIYYFTHNFNLVLSVILVVCADDVAVAVPLAYLIAAGKASRVGIIIKGSTYLESMGRAKVFLFDKTRTLTKGVLKVDSFEVL
ncbi:MAG: HAD-IC family P-type ATPase, partial [Candidatus Paceibacterota bacterium]